MPDLFVFRVSGCNECDIIGAVSMLCTDISFSVDKNVIFGTYSVIYYYKLPSNIFELSI